MMPRELFDANTTLSFWVLTRFFRRRKSDDWTVYEAAALEGLWYACLRYDGRGKFSTFAVPTIRFTILKEWKYENLCKRRFAKDLTNRQPFLDGLLSKDENDSELIDREHLSALENSASVVLATMEQRKRLIIEMKYGINGESPHTLEELGMVLRISKERVRVLHNDAIQDIADQTFRSKVLRPFYEECRHSYNSRLRTPIHDEQNPGFDNIFRAWEDAQESVGQIGGGDA